jgi:hypothetical protein
MGRRLVDGMLLALLVVSGMAACDSGLPWQPKGFSRCLAEFAAIADAIAKSSGYRIDYSDVVGNRTRMQLSVYDDQLESADEATREKAASVVVSAAERALATRPGCTSIEIISVGIYHPSGFVGPPRAWHMEDVVEFRKGPDQHFVLHVPGDAPRRVR